MTKFTTKNVAQTKKIAGDIIKQLTSGKQKQGALVVGLSGDLGAGKTAFTQGVAEVLGVKIQITSPTFVILKRYSLRNARYSSLIHIDAYRMENSQNLLTLGWEELIKDPKNIIIVEWAEKIKSVLPKDHIWIQFEHKKEDERKIVVKHNFKL